MPSTISVQWYYVIWINMLSRNSAHGIGTSPYEANPQSSLVISQLSNSYQEDNPSKSLNRHYIHVFTPRHIHHKTQLQHLPITTDSHGQIINFTPVHVYNSLNLRLLTSAYQFTYRNRVEWSRAPYRRPCVPDSTAEPERIFRKRAPETYQQSRVLEQPSASLQ